MSAYRLTPRAPLAARADLSGINPATLAGLSAQAVAWLTLPYGNGAVPLGDLFEVSEVAGDALLIGGDPRLDFVGAQMAEGEIEVDGPVGVLAGSGMVGGRLVIRGDVADGLAAGLEGGRIEVTGSAGAGVGGALTGDRQGMKGGTVAVAGSVGPSLGARMRGGLILVGGDAGPRAADGLIAGTIAVAGRLAEGVGRGMKRGTLIVATAPEAPGFVSTGSHDFVMLALLARRVPELSGLFGGRLAGRAERLVGNRVAGGTGEILVLQ